MQSRSWAPAAYGGLSFLAVAALCAALRYAAVRPVVWAPATEGLDGEDDDGDEVLPFCGTVPPPAETPATFPRRHASLGLTLAVPCGWDCTEERSRYPTCAVTYRPVEATDAAAVPLLRVEAHDAGLPLSDDALALAIARRFDADVGSVRILASGVVLLAEGTITSAACCTKAGVVVSVELDTGASDTVPPHCCPCVDAFRTVARSLAAVGGAVDDDIGAVTALRVASPAGRCALRVPLTATSQWRSGTVASVPACPVFGHRVATVTTGLVSTGLLLVPLVAESCPSPCDGATAYADHLATRCKSRGLRVLLTPADHTAAGLPVPPLPDTGAAFTAVGHREVHRVVVHRPALGCRAFYPAIVAGAPAEQFEAAAAAASRATLHCIHTAVAKARNPALRGSDIPDGTAPVVEALCRSGGAVRLALPAAALLRPHRYGAGLLTVSYLAADGSAAEPHTELALVADGRTAQAWLDDTAATVEAELGYRTRRPRGAVAVLTGDDARVARAWSAFDCPGRATRLLLTAEATAAAVPLDEEAPFVWALTAATAAVSSASGAVVFRTDA